MALPFWHGDPRALPDLGGRGYEEGSAGALALGDASWHHGWTLHCAPPNALATPRRALAASFFVDGAPRLETRGGAASSGGGDGDGARVPDDEDLESHAEWLGAVRPGAPARHALLPVVWPPQQSQQPRRPQRRGGSKGGAGAPSRGGGRGRSRGGRGSGRASR